MNNLQIDLSDYVAEGWYIEAISVAKDLPSIDPLDRLLLQEGYESYLYADLYAYLHIDPNDDFSKAVGVLKKLFPPRSSQERLESN